MPRFFTIALVFNLVATSSITIFGGCQSAPPARAPGGGVLTAADLPRSQGYALLYATVADESQVDMAMFLKSPARPVADLVKAIAQFAADAKKRLEILAKQDATIDLSDQGLPELETKTRAAISSVTGRQLLGSTGKEFEFRLLLTQHEALNYLQHLATTLADREIIDADKRFLDKFAHDAKELHDRVLALMQDPYAGAAK